MSSFRPNQTVNKHERKKKNKQINKINTSQMICNYIQPDTDRYIPYIFPSSDKMIFRRPHGGYMARASWKLCSMSGLQTPSASADDRSLSSSLMSPTSRCLSTDTPFRSACPNGPPTPELTGVHGEVMLPVPKKLSAMMRQSQKSQTTNK